MFRGPDFLLWFVQDSRASRFRSEDQEERCLISSSRKGSVLKRRKVQEERCLVTSLNVEERKSLVGETPGGVYFYCS